MTVFVGFDSNNLLIGAKVDVQTEELELIPNVYKWDEDGGANQWLLKA